MITAWGWQLASRFETFETFDLVPQCRAMIYQQQLVLLFVISQKGALEIVMNQHYTGDDLNLLKL